MMDRRAREANGKEEEMTKAEPGREKEEEEDGHVLGTDRFSQEGLLERDEVSKEGESTWTSQYNRKRPLALML